MQNKFLQIVLLGGCIIGGLMGSTHAQVSPPCVGCNPPPCVGCNETKNSANAIQPPDKMEKSPVAKANPAATAHHAKVATAHHVK